jgi:hypothetical protein
MMVIDNDVLSFMFSEYKTFLVIQQQMLLVNRYTLSIMWLTMMS